MRLKIPINLLFVFSSLLFAQLAFSHGMSEADKQAIVEGGNLQFIWLGATHMLTGYDHLLFVFGIVFFLTTILDVVKYITVFTIGHSITLITATLMGITANYYLVDAIIAISVCYIGYENLGGFKQYFKKPRTFYWRFLYSVLFMGLDCLPVYSNFRLARKGLSSRSCHLIWELSWGK